MNRETFEIDTAAITIKDSLRDDLGDLNALMNSIRRYGLLSPLVVDQNNVLIAGFRRFEACKRAGISRVHVTRYPIDYQSIDALDIQSDENLCRQQLTQRELDRHIENKKLFLRNPVVRFFLKLAAKIKSWFKRD